MAGVTAGGTGNVTGAGGRNEGVGSTLLATASTSHGVDVDKLAREFSLAVAANPGKADLVLAEVASRLSPVDHGAFLSKVDKSVSPAASFATPKTPAAAPKTIHFSTANQKTFDDLWGASFPGGKSKEAGGTLTYDRKSGNVGIQNLGGTGSTSGTFSPDTTLKDPKADAILGTFHTHPYDKGEGGYTGISFSGADAGYMINTGQHVAVVQSGTKQFMYMRTAQTPSSVDGAKLNNDQNSRIGELMGKGSSFAAASRQAASETATKFHLAYYEGSNGTLQRVNPK